MSKTPAGARPRATAPDADASAVMDLTVTAEAQQRARLRVTYRSQGDYDQNGEVNISDLTPVGLHSAAQEGESGWDAAALADRRCERRSRNQRYRRDRTEYQRVAPKATSSVHDHVRTA